MRNLKDAEQPMTPKSEKIKILMLFWDQVDGGKSCEEMTIMTEIYAAGGRIPEEQRGIALSALELIKAAHEEGMTRSETIDYLQDVLS
jgi:hypothetical protein